MIEQFDLSWYNAIANVSCLSTTNQLCNSNSDEIAPWAIADYCSNSMNMLTEDVCYDWYVNSIYPDKPKSDYYNSTSASTVFKYVCNKYPWHDQCKCNEVLKKFNADSFSMESDPSKVYNASCLFDACSTQKINLAYDPSNPRAYIPYDIVHDKTISCPDKLCTITIKDKISIMLNHRLDFLSYIITPSTPLKNVHCF